MPHLHHFDTPAPLAWDGAAFLFASASRLAAPQMPSWQTGTQTQPDSVSPHVSEEFMTLLKAYRPSGGLLRAQEAAARCKPHSGTDVQTLAGWIVRRKVVSFEWLHRIWLPLFQFNRLDMTRQTGLDAILSELTAVYDDWEIANWFARPNVWLAGCLPSATLTDDAPEVLEAARAERYLVAG
jgi:hypothetical protein